MAFKVIRNVIVTQKGKLMQKMKRTDMSSQLGFMSDVKKEIEIITSYLQMMEIYRKQEIRVIIEVTNLDKCLPDRVVEVLHAVDILLSNPDAPFICILAVDPGIIVECAEKSDLLKGMANNGYLFLNRIITLLFSIPQMSHHTKAKHLDNIIGDQAKSPENNENYEIKNQEQEVIDSRNPENAINKALQSVKSKECEFINDNVINMRRIVNTIGITIRLMIKDAEWKKIQFKVLKWVIMGAQWPCSLSWILQCIEDEQQSAKELHKAYLEKRLWDIYEMSLEALHANRKSLKQLLELDGDPDIFSKLLKDSKFTVKDANILRKFTVNLDPTIQRKIELLQGSFNFLRFKKDKIVSRLALLEMDTDAVCKAIGKLNIQKKKLKKYISMIEKHTLNGKALLYTDNKEIRRALGMTLGDWVTFRAAFLSLPTPTFLL
ncbi:NTPase KAP family P-loop domain-containing protein 1-like [Dendropsophus ebraccatus]|uniref:NTPase KAP family P-loop domain-containing protein 1-like n=1 Tax=Dendropsophus ebraccatus TaxID=150705 RepID=UPI0038320B5F